MSYTALSEVRKQVMERYGKDIGPFQPQLNASEDNNALKSAALRFIHNRCEELNFDFEKSKKEQEKSQRTGMRPVRRLSKRAQLTCGSGCYARSAGYARSGCCGCPGCCGCSAGCAHSADYARSGCSHDCSA